MYKRQDVASGSAKVVTGDSVYSKANNDDWGVPEGTAVQSSGETSSSKYLRTNGDGTCSWQTVSGGSGGATDIEDLDNVTKVGSYTGGDILAYDSASNSFKNTRSPAFQYPSAILFNGAFADVSANVPNVKLSAVTEGSDKNGIIEVKDDFIIKLDVQQDTGTEKKFVIRNGAGTNVFSVDENGAIKTTKFKDSSGNDKIEYETDKVKFLDDIKAATGKLKDNSDTTRIDFSSTDIVLSGDTKVGGLKLGGVDDTTITRTAAGKAAIAGKEIVTKNTQLNIHSYAYHYSGTSGHYIPMSGATTSDSTSLSVNSYHLMQIMPYDGRVVRIAVYNQTASTRTDKFELYINLSLIHI